MLSIRLATTAVGGSLWASGRFLTNTITLVFRSIPRLSAFASLTTGNGSLTKNVESKEASCSTWGHVESSSNCIVVAVIGAVGGVVLELVKQDVGPAADWFAIVF